MSHRLDHIAIAPQGMKALGGLYGYIVQSGLPASLVDLAYLRTSQINGCAYCIDLHSRDLLKGGMSVETLVLVPTWREAGPLFNQHQRAALAWAESVTLVSTTGVPDEDFAAVAAVFDEKELVDLTLAIGMMNTYNRMAISFRAVPQAANTTDGAAS
jgi:AhpD family alkylhydroperoxidase